MENNISMEEDEEIIRRRRLSSRTASISFTPGIEGNRRYSHFADKYEEVAFGVFTSGGDAQGMNSALRAIARMGIFLGCHVYFIHEGYEGMVRGGNDMFTEPEWYDLSDTIGMGGTIIGSARCKSFRERSGRLKAAKNLIDRSICRLVCIGGDGSLTGAYTFKQEWPDLVETLLAEGRITTAQAISCAHLNIVGLVGSIDNDFCGTDMTIGADTALHRIFEAVDAISTTGSSHMRCFVMEVMGRRCGYLALMTAIGSEADWIFIPEYPAGDNWQEKMCCKLETMRELGQRLNIIIVAEGAVDIHGVPISSDQVKQVIIDRLKYDTRVTVLGHVQRGGTISAFDRVLATRMGAEAVVALMEAEVDTAPVVMSLSGNQAVRVELTTCVERTILAGKAMDEGDYKKAIDLRGRSFSNNLNMYIQLANLKPKHPEKPKVSFNVAILHIGAPACGMNAASRSVVRCLIYKGHQPILVYEGFFGLVNDKILLAKWNSVLNWTGQGGSALGTKKLTAKDAGLDALAASIKKFNIHAFIIIGGFEGYLSILQLYEARQQYPEFQIPYILIPATISNNIPGTDFSLGADTALNEIISMVDKMKQSAQGSKHRVFILETMGGYCGYLALVSGLACGADQAYIYEEPTDIDNIVDDASHLKVKMTGVVKRGIILRSEKANENFNADFLRRLFSEYGKGVYSARANILGHQQQGGSPSPFDRSFATKLGTKAVNLCVSWLEESQEKNGNSKSNEEHTAAVLGMTSKTMGCTSIVDLKDQTDFEHRISKKIWWLKLRPLLRILSKHDSVYVPEIVKPETEL